MLAKILRDAAKRGQYGHSRTPDNFYISEMYVCRAEYGRDVDQETWARVVALSERYRQFVRYCREVLPEWREVRQIHWADNSIDSVQVDKDGNERRVQLAAPSGDACF